MLKQNIRRLIKRPLITELVFSVLYTGCIAFIPYLNKLLFDGMAKDGVEALFRLIPVYFLTIIGSALFQYVSQVKEWDVDRSFTVGIKSLVFASIFRKRPADYYASEEGEYLSKVNNNVDALMEEYVEAIIDMLKAAIQIVIYAVILFVLVDYRIAVVILSTSLVSVLVPRITAKKIAKKRKNYMDKLGIYIDRLADYFAGFRGLDVPSKESVIKHHEKVLAETEEFKFSWGKFKTFTNVTNGFVMDLISFSAFIMVGLLYVRGEITVGTGIATFGYIESFIYPIKYILNDINAIHSSGGLMTEMEELVQKERTLTEENEETGRISEIEFREITVRRGEFSLENVNLSFRAGKSYGIIGESGTGKSTLLSLLTGEVLPEKGKIFVNGEERTGKMDAIASLRMFFLPQKPHLFHMDYLNNVTNFGTYEGTALSELEKEIPEKFLQAVRQTESAELSGGEKQVLGILKARLADKQVFLIDESFSAIDRQNADSVKAFFHAGKKEDTIIIEVTHEVTKENLARFDEVIRL